MIDDEDVIENDEDEVELDTDFTTETDLVANAIDQKPMDFKQNFGDLLLDRIRSAVDDKKMEMAAAEFEPEGDYEEGEYEEGDYEEGDYEEGDYEEEADETEE